MASLAPCSSVQAPLDPEAHWISPEEQLYRLALPMAGELANKHKGKLPILINHSLERSIVECAARSILKRSDIWDQRIPSLQVLAVAQLLDPILDPSPLPSHLTTWYKALKRIDQLPEKIPPLPPNILEILNQPCPKKICSQKKPGGAPFTSGEKCTLILIPQELENPDKFEKVVKSFGEKHYPKDKNPLQYRFFWSAAREQHGKTPFGPTCWICHTNDVLEKSRNKPWVSQAAMVDALAKETLVHWQVPESVYETFLLIALTEIGTGKRLYQIADEQNGYSSTYTRVQQMTQLFRLAVGGSAPSGVSVDNYYVFDCWDVGIAARLKF